MIDLNSRQVARKDMRQLENQNISSKDSSPKKENIATSSDEDMKEMKEKLRIMTLKFQNAKKEMGEVKKERDDLQNEVIHLQHSIIPGFACTGSTFPLVNELSNEVSEFLKCTCQDCFFDVLCPELNFDGIVFFFKHTFGPILKQLQVYFEPMYSKIE